MRKSLVFAIIMVICSVTSCLHKVSENNDCVSNTFQNPILSSGHNPQAIFYKGEFYQFNLSSCIRQQNSLTAQFVSFSLSNLANIFYPPQFLQ